MDSSPVITPTGTFAGQPAVLSLSRRVAAKLRGAPLISLGILALLVFTAIFADFLAPHNPEVGNLRLRYRPPAWEARGSSEFILGTDHMGRDVLSRIIYGSRISLVVALAAVVVAGAIGTALGIISGYLGGWVDQVIMRITDTWLALPPLMLAILLAAVLRPSKWNIVVILGLLYWTRYARVIRGEVLSLREREFVKLAEIAGGSRARVIFRHILPNVLNSTMVLASLTIGVVIIAEASLSFLGVGVPPPEPAWGSMLADGRSMLMVGDWWLTIFPGLGILLVVLATQLLGDWLRVRLDPQLRNM